MELIDENESSNDPKVKTHKIYLKDYGKVITGDNKRKVSLNGLGSQFRGVIELGVTVANVNPGIVTLDEYNRSISAKKKRDLDQIGKGDMLNILKLEIGGFTFSWGMAKVAGHLGGQATQNLKMKIDFLVDQFLLELCNKKFDKPKEELFNGLATFRSKREFVQRLQFSDIREHSSKTGIGKSFIRKKVNSGSYFFCCCLKKDTQDSDLTDMNIYLNGFITEVNLSYDPGYCLTMINHVKTFANNIKKTFIGPQRPNPDQDFAPEKPTKLNIDLKVIDLRFLLLFHDSMKIIAGPDKLVIHYDNFMDNLATNQFFNTDSNWLGSEEKLITTIKPRHRQSVDPSGNSGPTSFN